MAADHAGNINLIIRSAIQQLQQAIDLTVKLRSSLVQIGDHFSESQNESARVLSEEVLQSCRAAVSLLTSAAHGVHLEIRSDMVVDHRSPSFSSIVNAVAGHQDPQQPLLLAGTDEEEGHQQHTAADTCEWENITEAPFNDGFEWRKYGEKKIGGSDFTRSYFRCTYSKERRCKARKQVQQQKDSFPSLYLVTYKGEHTCRREDDEQQQQQQVQSQGFNSFFVPPDNDGEGRFIICQAVPPLQSKSCSDSQSKEVRLKCEAGNN